MTELEQLITTGLRGPYLVETDGYDPEWPLWYANHVADDVRRILERPDLTVSRLVWAIVAADQSHRSEAPDVPWSRYYAEWFIAEL